MAIFGISLSTQQIFINIATLRLYKYSHLLYNYKNIHHGYIWNWLYTPWLYLIKPHIAVIGAGPAGILLVAEAYLQCKKNNQNDTIIYWYDKEHFTN